MNSSALKMVNNIYFTERDKNKIADFYKINALKESISEVLIKYHLIEVEEARKIMDFVIFPKLLQLKGII